MYKGCLELLKLLGQQAPQRNWLCLQATHSGFSLINQDNVFKVCDQPHPLLVANMINHCLSAEIDPAFGIMKNLCDLGYSATDIITTLFRVVRNYKMQEFLKLEFIKVYETDWIDIELHVAFFLCF